MWYYINKEGNPKEEGYYYCTLVAETTDGRKVAYGDMRQFSDVSNVLDSYHMEGQPRTGLGWTRDADGYQNEKVYAWTPDTRTGFCELPSSYEKVVVVGNDD